VSDHPSRGRLKMFLGYAAGVGKTYQMLAEGQDLHKHGIDVVIGYFEPHARAETIALTEGLETVPRRVVEHRGSRFEEMDAEAILARRPRVVMVDEFAHTNVPFSPRSKRWEDVHVLLDAGIDVLTTMNVQHLESLNDQVWQSTNVRVRETVPDWVVRAADEIVMVDLTPRALLNRLRRGVVYPPDRARAALHTFFREPALVALRELAMRQTAHAAESREQPAESATTESAGTAAVADDRLLLLITPDPASAALIRRGRRVADYLQAECLAVLVAGSSDLRDLSAEERKSAERHLNFARGLHIDARILEAADVPQSVVEFARLNRVSQIFLLREKSRGFPFPRRGLVQRIVSLAGDMQVTIVSDRSSSGPRPGR
jgi:two-component system sensor histidine kinase KdpD